ncbi:MAG: hypothetical protein MdMp014T_2936 [Treponematales bacterium]
MAIQQTVQIPASRRLSFKVPAEVPAGKAKITVKHHRLPRAQTAQSRPAGARRGKPPAPLTEAEMAAGVPCSLCAYYSTPNAETVAAMEEGEAILRGEIPGKWYDSVEELLADLKKG